MNLMKGEGGEVYRGLVRVNKSSLLSTTFTLSTQLDKLSFFHDKHRREEENHS